MKRPVMESASGLWDIKEAVVFRDTRHNENVVSSRPVPPESSPGSQETTQVMVMLRMRATPV